MAEMAHEERDWGKNLFRIAQEATRDENVRDKIAAVTDLMWWMVALQGAGFSRRESFDITHLILDHNLARGGEHGELR